MSQKKIQIFQDFILLAVGISFAIFISRTGLVHKLVLSLGSLKYAGVIIAGMFFTSIFTIAPSIAMLAEFSQTMPVSVVAILGGMGAVIGDFIIFRFVKDRVSEDFDFLLSSPKGKRLAAVFNTKSFHHFMPFLGALIIASPFPDEIGIAMLGMSKVRDRVFFPLSFILNAGGIFIVGWIAKFTVGL